MRTIAFRATAACAGFFDLVAVAPAQDSRYQLRFNRYEGFWELPYAGEQELRLLSLSVRRSRYNSPRTRC